MLLPDGRAASGLMHNIGIFWRETNKFTARALSVFESD